MRVTVSNWLAPLALTLGWLSPAVAQFGPDPNKGPVLTNVLPVVTVVASKPDASEDGPVPGAFTISRTGDTATDLTVFYTLGGTALNGLDYTMLPGFVMIPAGSASTDVAVDPLLDIDLHPKTNDTVVIQLRPRFEVPLISLFGTYQVGYPSNAVVTISESTTVTNPPPSVAILQPNDGAKFEAPANIEIVARAHEGEASVTSVEFFASGQSLGVVTNPVSNATPFRYSLTWSNVVAGTYSLTATATDDQGHTNTSAPVSIEVVTPPVLPVVTVVATDPNASEKGPDPGVFTITRTGDTTNRLVVFYSLGGTALNGIDYDMLPSFVTIPAGATSADVTVKPVQDRDRDPQTNDTVVLQLHPLIDPLIGSEFHGIYRVGYPSNDVVTIAENVVVVTNGTPVVKIIHPEDGDTFDPASDIVIVAEAGERGGFISSVEFFAGSVSLGVVSNDMAAATAHFSVTWSNVVVGDYDLTAKATDAHGTTATSAKITIHVVTPPPLPVVTVVATDPDASETGPDTGTFTVSRTGATNDSLVVAYKLGGSARNGIDYAHLADHVTIPAGAASADITVTPIQDNDPTDTRTNETVELQLQPILDLVVGSGHGPYGIGFPSNAVVNIAESVIVHTNPPTVVTVVATDPDASETGPDTGTFTVSRTGATNDSLVVSYKLGGSARNGIDYDKLGDQVTIPAGASSADITVTPIQDNDPTDTRTNETVELQLRPRLDLVAGSGHGPYGIGFPSNAVVNIAESLVVHTNVAPVVTVVATDPNASESGPDTGTFTVSRTGETNDDLVVFFALGGSARNGVDYTKLPERVTIPAGSASADVTVTPIPDKDRADGRTNETVILQLRPVLDLVIFGGHRSYQLGWPSNDVVTISEPAAPPPQPEPPTVWIVARDPIAREGQGTNIPPKTASFVVHRTDGTNADLTVTYSLSGTASNGVDYAELPGSITIPAGHHNATITLTPLDDTQPEKPETVVVTLDAAPTNTPPLYVLGHPKRATAIILDRSSPDPGPRTLVDGQFHLALPGSAGLWFQIEASADLAAWDVIAVNLATEDTIHFVDPDASQQHHRFYRAVPVAPDPSDGD